MQGFRTVLAIRDARRVLLLGTVVRVPIWAGNVVLTLHVVSHLHRTYADAGVLVGVEAVALSLSNPWRGRRLDRVGLRRALVPSLVVLTACWSVAPFVGYWPLLALVAVGGVFTVPTFSIVRQALVHAVPESDRTAALSLDSVLVEVSFMVGPALGVLLATALPTPWALFVCEFAAVLGSLAIWVADPALRADREPGDGTTHAGVRAWLSVATAVVLLMSAGAILVLNGSDVGVVAALRHMHHQPWIGWELAVWALGSAVGGLIYGARNRPVPLPLLLGLLGASAIPVALAREPFTFAVLLFVTGAFCAPTITASVDALTRLVPERVRGEALGWHAAALTAGGALGAPVAGVAIDGMGWPGAFVVPGGVGAALALVGAAVVRGRVSVDADRAVPHDAVA
jgi:MFS family permease